MNNQEISLTAISDSNLKKFLIQKELLESLQESQLECQFCNDIITTENLTALYEDLEEKEIKFVCDKVECLHNLSNYSITK